MYVPVRDDEVPAIVALINRAYRGEGSSTEWSTETPFLAGDRTTDAALRAELVAQPIAVLLKWVDGEAGDLTGCVWLEPLGSGKWYLGSLAVDPGKQNGGLGRTMLMAAEQWIAERGGSLVRLTVVNVRVTLIAWYVRRGYRVTGETEPFPYSLLSSSAPLRDDFCLVVLEKVLASASP